MKVQPNQGQDGSLRLALAAVQSQVSGLTLRCKQAEEANASLIQERLPVELRDELFQKILGHIEAREAERSAQYKGVIFTTLVALNETAQACVDLAAKASLVEVIKSLTLTMECNDAALTSRQES